VHVLLPVVEHQVQAGKQNLHCRPLPRLGCPAPAAPGRQHCSSTLASCDSIGPSCEREREALLLPEAKHQHTGLCLGSAAALPRARLDSSLIPLSPLHQESIVLGHVGWHGGPHAQQHHLKPRRDGAACTSQRPGTRATAAACACQQLQVRSPPGGTPGRSGGWGRRPAWLWQVGKGTMPAGLSGGDARVAGTQPDSQAQSAAGGSWLWRAQALMPLTPQTDPSCAPTHTHLAGEGLKHHNAKAAPSNEVSNQAMRIHSKQHSSNVAGGVSGGTVPAPGRHSMHARYSPGTPLNSRGTAMHTRHHDCSRTLHTHL
jgi:hypothetical protein